MVSLLFPQISLFLYLAAPVFRISELRFFTLVAFACIVAFVGNTLPQKKINRILCENTLLFKIMRRHL